MNYQDDYTTAQLDDQARDAFGLPTVEEERALAKKHQAELQKAHERELQDKASRNNVYAGFGDENEPSSAEIRAKYTEAQQKVDGRNNARQLEIDANFVADEFLKATPDYIPCKENGALMMEILGDSLPSHEAMDAAWKQAKATGRAKVRLRPSIPSRAQIAQQFGGGE
jgi:hypothetical protein